MSKKYVLHRNRRPRINPSLFNLCYFYTILTYAHANYEGLAMKKMEYEFLIKISNSRGKFWVHESELHPMDVKLYVDKYINERRILRKYIKEALTVRREFYFPYNGT